MFLNSWSLALTLCSLVVLILGAVACRTAFRVLRHWDPASDSSGQIRLESEIWLSSTLVSYGLGFQIVTLVLFVLAADQFSRVIVGAMCATGSLLANSYGMPALMVKLVGVFFYGFWIVLHQLDIRSEVYPLVRIKYVYLLFLYPLLLLDISLQTLYIAGLEPDIITSCCAVVFNPASGGGANLLTVFSRNTMLFLYYGTMVVLGGSAFLLLRRPGKAGKVFYSLGWSWFLGLALVVITSVVSSYIYAMPYHHCPFCILKPEYHYIGFAIYGTLIPAAFFGISVALVEPLKRKKEIAVIVEHYQHFSLKASLLLLFVFALITSYYPLRYILAGGEI